MEPIMITRNEFLQRYWNYYLILEKDFLETERFLAIDELNFSTFSNEYIKQYQAICSEIDVIAKSFCKESDFHFTGNKMNAYCKTILDNNTDFSSHTVIVKDRDIQLTPWENWSYSIDTQDDGTTKIVAKNPRWWKIYNKIKHNRTTVNDETNLPYYKLANQQNVINGLAALFQLEMYYHRLLQKNHFPNDPDIPDPSSNLFEIKDWEDEWIVSSSGIYLRTF